MTKRYQSVLKNGLRVITTQLSGRETVGLVIWVRVGARFESKRLSGISHFAEHMVFKGTKNRSTKKIKEDIEGVGGMLNAFTSEECTCFFVKIPKRHFSRAFDVLQDMVNHSVSKPEDFEKERAVILEEIKMYMDVPSQYVQEMITELLWPKQPLGRPISGTLETVAAFKRMDLIDHIKSYYHPQNILITACGEIDPSEVEKMAEQCFPEVCEDVPSKHGLVKTFPKPGRYYFLDKKSEQINFVLGFEGLSRVDPKRYQLILLNIILGANMSSRLFEEIRERRGLAYDIKSGASFLNDTGALLISAGVEPEKTPVSIRVIMKELGKLKHKKVPVEELDRAKEYFLGQLTIGLEDTLDQALWAGDRVLYGGSIPTLEEIKDAVKRATGEDIQRLAGKIFQTSKVRLALIGPLNKKFEEKIKKECVCP
ncbi:MAG: hypothetical protein A3G33_10590 [Omnitrophica bacterium RIFCSPLOWO2_12_FULL_44_17]|uniref:Peptidase M16 n=1 Tax=Candidatus Danuiimicrobium aquiferis TaxID=1801832 RepID=A0A1G1KR68_9BACT|nr:MAG: hypothetical protein A3B72_02910 [Omnitrophica bacterium RIFCSPHIGHO2_02_FULL_45_28]OGW89511.1 MAG: hypothetical protein A3E74_07000 [Omnitrophica bacterium RIFCSPHIGHO2_12_FULL_44_12]OGW95417.1 MAG: hypothetical protein A3G33_10590 [Omnitrophica bacterium RIFCSPLOWO2_12_FULL_44_17]OGX03299.1 MAG: hypothetical protein A3J12_07225 [Omnitrophica bacterium RIFCSPLOWO2_02_FULL_44_11]